MSQLSGEGIWNSPTCFSGCVQFHWSENPSVGAASVFVHFFRASRERAGAVTEGIVHQWVTARMSPWLDACLEELFKRFAPPVVQSGRENLSAIALVVPEIRGVAAIFRSSGPAGPARPTEPPSCGGLGPRRVCRPPGLVIFDKSKSRPNEVPS